MVFLIFFPRGTFYASFFLALRLGLSFPSAKLVPVPGLLSPYVPLTGLLLLFLAWESDSQLGSEERHLTEEEFLGEGR